ERLDRGQELAAAEGPGRAEEPWIDDEQRDDERVVRRGRGPGRVVVEPEVAAEPDQADLLGGRRHRRGGETPPAAGAGTGARPGPVRAVRPRRVPLRPAGAGTAARRARSTGTLRPGSTRPAAGRRRDPAPRAATRRWPPPQPNRDRRRRPWATRRTAGLRSR